MVVPPARVPGWLAAASLAAAMHAQAPVPLRGQGLVEITRAALAERVTCMPLYQHGSAPTRNGALFVLVARASQVRTVPGGSVSGRRALELWRSDDRGTTWRQAAVVPTPNATDGSLAPDGDQLACAWSANHPDAWSNVFWQRYDVQRDAWIGAPAQLTTGSGQVDQYFATDLVRTANGACVVAIGCHASPPAPWTCGWSTGVRWLAAGKGEWSALQQVNGDNYGVSGNLLVRGDLVDFTYRTCPNAAVHGLRTFDAAKGELLAPAPPATDETPGADDHIANLGLWCGDATGGRTLLHLRGAHAGGRGRLAVAFARGAGAFRTTDLVADEPLHAGNENPTHFALARGPGNQVFAYFGKASEQFANLWQCAIEDGAPIGAPRIVVKGEANQFVSLNGMRVAEAWSGLQVVVRRCDAQQPGGSIAVFGTWPARTVFADAGK